MGPSAWYANQYKNRTEHIYDLSPQDLAELDAVVAAVVQSGKDIQASPRQTCSHCPVQVLSVLARLTHTSYANTGLELHVMFAGCEQARLHTANPWPKAGGVQGRSAHGQRVSAYQVTYPSLSPCANCLIP